MLAVAVLSLLCLFFSSLFPLLFCLSQRRDTRVPEVDASERASCILPLLVVQLSIKKKRQARINCCCFEAQGVCVCVCVFVLSV